MGAEQWRVRGPWRENVAEALAETRERVFREGSYQPVHGRSFATLAELDAFFMREPSDDYDPCEDTEGSEGTCSILDIRGVSVAVEPGSAAPVTEARLREVFGTITPTPDEVTTRRLEPLTDTLDRGECLYIVAYEGGTPSAIVFIGYSWD